MATDPALRIHVDWLGYVQPVGLVVSPPALINAHVCPSPELIAVTPLLNPLTSTGVGESVVLPLPSCPDSL